MHATPILQPISAPRRAPGKPSPALALLSWIVLVLAAVKLAVTLAVSGRYGFHRDELYYLAAGRHPAWGYVDFPPITPTLARIETFFFGPSLVGLRLLPALTGALIVLLAGLMARELGAGARGQGLAAAAVALAPLYLGGNLLFQTLTFDQLAWAAVLFLVLRLLRTGNLRLWLPIGVVMGIGLMTKYTILALALGLVVGMILTPARVQLRTRWPWLAGLIALGMLAPNLIWQMQHGWISLDFLVHHHGQIQEDSSPLTFVVQQLLFAGPVGLPLALVGFYALFMRRQFRLLGWACLVVELGFLLAGGKAYYPGPIYAVLFAAGSAHLASASFGRWPRRLGLGAGAFLVAGSLVLVPVSLPVLPARAMADSGLETVRTDYGEMVGWPELVNQVAQVYSSLPAERRASTAILAENYGEAGAIDLYGPRLGLPPALSGHLTYFYWKPAHVHARTVIAVGFPPFVLTSLFVHVREAETIGNRYGLQNEEFGRTISVCDTPRISLDEAWPGLQHGD